MASRPRGSFVKRLALAYAAAAIGLMFLIGFASTFFMFQAYARASNDVIASATRTLDRRVAASAAQHVPLARAARQLTADIARPRIRVAVYDRDRRLLSESAPAREPVGLVGAVAALMDLHSARIPVAGGFVTVTADLRTLESMMRAYWTLMVAVGVVAIVLAWVAGWAITRRAVFPLVQVTAAMRRFARGDFQAEPLRAAGDDEIGELAASYNLAQQQVGLALAQRDRSEAEIRQFIADAGHELRTPLTVIMGYLDVLEDGACDAPATRERVFANLRQESRRMRSLIEKLILLARLERGEAGVRELVDVSEVVSRTVQAFGRAEAPAPIEVTTVPDARVIADPADIAEAVRNLVDNALKYAAGSGVAVSTAIREANVVLVVRDAGPGMSDHVRAHAFDRFYRGGNGEVEGSGLGLAIVRGAVHRSAGTIELASREGEGTEFTIRLPLAAGWRGTPA